VRIAFVSPEFVTESNYDGGLANYLQRAGASLLALGHEPHVIVASDRDGSFDHHGILVHRVDVRPGPLQRLMLRVLRRYGDVLRIPFQSFKLNQRLRRLQLRHPYAVAQFSSYLATALFRPRSIPSVVRLSSIESLWSHAYERDSGPTCPARLISFLEQCSLARANRLIGPSRLLADVVEKATGRPVSLIESPFVPLAGELDDSIYRQHLATRRYILFFGTIGLLKGVRCLAEILDPLLSHYKDLQVVFVGKDGRYLERPMLEYVRTQAGEHCDRIIHFDRMPHETLYPIIDGADAVVLPSRVDNFPNACLEAMSRGKVVVGTRGASFDQLITDGESGFLCEIDDRKSLLAAVRRALDTEHKVEIGERARARIDELCPERAGARLVEVYEDLEERTEDICKS
jgi:glycosyltransferase involved in cell wall biosynthesis